MSIAGWRLRGRRHGVAGARGAAATRTQHGRRTAAAQPPGAAGSTAAAQPPHSCQLRPPPRRAGGSSCVGRASARRGHAARVAISGGGGVGWLLRAVRPRHGRSTAAAQLPAAAIAAACLRGEQLRGEARHLLPIPAADCVRGDVVLVKAQPLDGVLLGGGAAPHPLHCTERRWRTAGEKSNSLRIRGHFSLRRDASTRPGGGDAMVSRVARWTRRAAHLRQSSVQRAPPPGRRNEEQDSVAE